MMTFILHAAIYFLLALCVARIYVWMTEQAWERQRQVSSADDSLEKIMERVIDRQMAGSKKLSEERDKVYWENYERLTGRVVALEKKSSMN